MSKILIISLDGASWTVLDPLIEDGTMPNLRNLARRGSHGKLHSVVPPVTAPAWSSFMTGKQPDKHGVPEFRCFDIDNKTYKISNSSYIQGETIWQILSRHGKKVISLNVPYTYPVYDVRGILVSGMDTPSKDSEFCAPTSIKKVISEKFPDYTPSMKAWNMSDISNENNAARYIDQLIKMVELRMELSAFLLSKHEWDVSMIHFQETDYLQHVMWDRVIETAKGTGFRPIHGAIRNFYQKIDHSIERLCKIADTDNDTNVFIISDHGFTNHRGVIYPNVSLEKAGLVVRNIKSPLTHALKRRIRNTKNPFLKAAYTLQKRLRIAFNVNHPLTVYETLEQQNAWEREQINWDESGAVMVMGSQYAFVYVRNARNVQLCKKILEGIHDGKTGAPLFSHILRPYEAYGRKEADAGNMIIAIPQEGYSVSNRFKDCEVKIGKSHPGIHHPDGVFIACGSDLKCGPKQDLNLIDITPTCLHLLGLPITSDMDGKILRSVIKNNERAQVEEVTGGPPKCRKEYDVESEKLVREQLRALGYID